MKQEKMIENITAIQCLFHIGVVLRLKYIQIDYIWPAEKMPLSRNDVVENAVVLRFNLQR